MDELKEQLNKYFVYLDENHFTCRVFVQMSRVNMGADKDEDIWKMFYYIFVFIQTACAQNVSRDFM